MGISVIIVSFNSGPLLAECVRSVLACSGVSEIIVSDNGSTDCSIESLEDPDRIDSRLIVLRNGRNLGFAVANNIALTKACGKYILFLNPDCILRPDTIDRVRAVLESNPQAGMAGCMIRNPDGTEQTACRRSFPTPIGLLGKLFGTTDRNTAPPLPTHPISVDAISGAFMLVRRQALIEVGSFDEDFFLHWEDLDLCRRFVMHGYQILFVPDVEILHYKGYSSRKRPLRVEWHKHHGLMRYFRKHHFQKWPSPLFSFLQVAISLHFAARCMLHPFGLERTPIGRSATLQSGPEVWVFGASSLVGCFLLPRLLSNGYRVRAFSSDPLARGCLETQHLTWAQYDINKPGHLLTCGNPDVLISLVPIYLLPDWIAPLALAGLRKLIVFSSTSRYTKMESTSAAERNLAKRLAHAEDGVVSACRRVNVDWVILRPTLIYSVGLDRNISLLASFIRTFRFFPMPCQGRGARQPVHADDLAKACLAILTKPAAWNRSFNLGGGEVLPYRVMVERLFQRAGHAVRIVTPPLIVWRCALALARCIPAYRGIRIEMVLRADTDMCADNHEASRIFGFSPRPFVP